MIFVYRYRDINQVNTGAAELYLERRAVIKETEHYVYHVHLPFDFKDGDELEPVEWYFKNQGYYRARKSKKDAHRSAWRLEKQKALADWFIRKEYQLSRMRLVMERIELIKEAAMMEGIIVPNVKDSPRPVYDRLTCAPDSIVGACGPEADNYNWMEW